MFYSDSSPSLNSLASELSVSLLNFLQPRVLERHFLDLRKKYGNVLAVDLVNKVDTGFMLLIFAK